MDNKDLSPDDVVLWRWGAVSLSLTIVYTWVVMGLLVAGAWLATRRLGSGPRASRWQTLLETIVEAIRDQIRQVGRRRPEVYLPFIGTLFLFVVTCNLLAVVPGFEPPTASLSTTAALALCVLVAVPVFGVVEQGPLAYLRQYMRPTPLMLPFNVIGELSRTLALAVRLFGNMMSGTKIVAILLAIVPFFVSIPIMALGLLTGLIQAYIFAILAMVYIASASQTQIKELGGPDSETAVSEETEPVAG